MSIGSIPAVRGTPSWEPVERIWNSDIGATHTQTVRFVSGKKYYTAIFTRFYNKRLPQGQRTSVDVAVIRDSTGRESKKLSALMLQSGWVSTFNRNVREWAENF